jgi:hypothetical protein
MADLYPSLARRQKASGSFLKKRTKKLLFSWHYGCRTARTNQDEFFGSFL